MRYYELEANKCFNLITERQIDIDNIVLLMGKFTVFPFYIGEYYFFIFIFDIHCKPVLNEWLGL